MFFYEIYEIFKNTYFEEHLRTTPSSSSSLKLGLVDLTVFPDLNLRLAKNKSFTAVCISSKFSSFCSHAFSWVFGLSALQPPAPGPNKISIFLK